jgi:hypothetical protein
MFAVVQEQPAEMVMVDRDTLNGLLIAVGEAEAALQHAAELLTKGAAAMLDLGVWWGEGRHDRIDDRLQRVSRS